MLLQIIGCEGVGHYVATCYVSPLEFTNSSMEVITYCTALLPMAVAFNFSCYYTTALAHLPNIART